ncbi:hypothetical protein ABW20_dc0103848 [Dactylellina cionopaga]|nr:hypothetical protein ABW20_dc0103848 [Dactylellina cionopaga]
MPPSNPLSDLPYELIREISLNLDKASIKSLRLACPYPKICAATSKPLFKTIVLRLGTREWGLLGTESRLAYMDLKHESTVLFADCKKLVIDTRYPFNVTTRECIQFHKRLEEEGPGIYYDILLKRARFAFETVASEDFKFHELLRRALAAAKDLRVIE